MKNTNNKQLKTLSEQNLHCTEFFSSIQGESSYVGLPSTFIRLSACNLRCTWCDTTYSFSRGKKYSFSQIQKKVQHYANRHICITGGEPLLQKEVLCLISHLCDDNYSLSLETGGSLSIQEVDPRCKVILDVKCPGSGMEAKNLYANFDYLLPHHEIKFVLKDKDDYHFAKRICINNKLQEKVQHILFSPVHGVLNPQDLVQWILKDKFPARINLQVHKLIWPDIKKGV